MAEKGRKGSPLGHNFGDHFRHFSIFWSFFWRPDFQSVFGRLLSLILEGFGGDFLGNFLYFLGHFVDSSAEVENVVWTHYLL